MLREALGSEASNDYQELVEEVAGGGMDLHGHEVAILIIDPQESFTSGAWKRSIGPGGDREVEPLKLAFANCAALLESCGGRIETMFTRCPFPPRSYGWDERVVDHVDERQPYFVKPGNSALWPPTNGVREWVEALARARKRALVVGGCTLNSCVRISAVELQKHAGDLGLQVVVDLSLCGARLENYARSPEFEGRSSVESAVRQMTARGVLARSSIPVTGT
jgi:nicotinamidase-related amidase